MIRINSFTITPPSIFPAHEDTLRLGGTGPVQSKPLFDNDNG